MTDQLDTELRGVFTRNTTASAVPAAVRARLVGRDYHPRTANRGLVTGFAAAVAIAGISIPLALGAGTQHPTAGPAIRMAFHTFQLPAGYRLTAATSAPCHPFAVYLGPPKAPHASAQRSAQLAGMRAAASAGGGCLVFALAPPYKPTAAVPDPEAYPNHPVQVGNYHGFIFHMSMDVLKGAAGKHGLAPGWHYATNLWVQLPAGNGQLRDLAVGATGLSDQALINLVAQGLSS
ncbi:MAG TPA: hypothetical protein VH641_05120 [Streptosporangiaceae bacterium]